MTRLATPALYAGAAVLVLVLTVLTMAAPNLALIAVVCAIAVVLAFKPLGRLAIFAGGIIALFQSSSIPGSARAAFLVVAIALAVPALRSTMRGARERGINLSRFIAPSAILAVLVAISTVSLLWSPRSLDDWTRDATTYVLIILAPVFGLDAALHAKRRSIEALVVIVGFVGAFSYLVAWLSRRGYGILGLEQFALASSLLVIPSIAMCLVYCYRPGGQRWVWGLMGMVQIGMLASAGGRSALIYLAALILAFVLLGGFIGSWWRGFTTIAVTAAVAGWIVISLTGSLGLQDFLTGRYDWFADASFTTVQTDLSGQARLRAIGYMLDGFTQAPLLGNGLGVNYTNVTLNVVTAGTYSLDTPLTALAKFGIIGTALLVMSVALFIRAAGTVAPAGNVRRTAGVFLAANVFTWLAMLLNGLPTEQKGFAVQIALVAAITTVWAVTASVPLANQVARQGQMELASVAG